FALRVTDGRDVAVDPDIRTVLATITLLDEETLAVFKETAVKFGVMWPIVWMCNLVHPQFQQFGLDVADDIAVALIDQRELSCRIACVYARHHLLRQSSPGANFAFAQRLHRPRPFGGGPETRGDIAQQLQLVRAPITRSQVMNAQGGFPSLFAQHGCGGERASAQRLITGGEIARPRIGLQVFNGAALPSLYLLA